MDAGVDYTDHASREERPTSPRVVAAEKLELFDKLDSPWTSCSQISRQLEVPDSSNSRPSQMSSNSSAGMQLSMLAFRSAINASSASRGYMSTGLR